MPDLDLYHLLIQQMPVGTFDGADYIRLDAVWCVPHDGSMPVLVGPWSTWPLTTPARMLASERQLHEMQTALTQRDALIVTLTQELEAARRVPEGVAAAATGMEANRAAPPVIAARPADPDPELLPFDAENDPETPRRISRHWLQPELPPAAPEPAPEPWCCPVCGRDAHAKHPTLACCLDCAAKLPKAA